MEFIQFKSFYPTFLRNSGTFLKVFFGILGIVGTFILKTKGTYFENLQIFKTKSMFPSVFS